MDYDLLEELYHAKEEDLYNNAHIYSSDHLEIPVYDSSTDSNGSPFYKGDLIQERTTSKDKRREIVRKCESKRRKRMKDLFEELRQIVLPYEHKKVTQEVIILEAVKRLREMQAKLDEMKPGNEIVLEIMRLEDRDSHWRLYWRFNGNTVSRGSLATAVDQYNFPLKVLYL
jgi:hypothetical protein